MSAFADAFIGRQAALDSAFGEPLLIVPQLAGEFTAAGADPANPAFTAIGVLDVEGVVVDGSGRKTAARSEVETTNPVVDFALTQFGPGRPQPVKGWLITATSRLGSPSYAVLDALPDGVGRIVCQLAPLP
jgi:hypothetical protein